MGARSARGWLVFLLIATGVSFTAERSRRPDTRRSPPAPRPGLFDSYLEVFRGHPLVARLDGSEAARMVIEGCPRSGCADICVESADPDEDGTMEVEPGDIVHFGTQWPRTRTHVVTSVAIADPQCTDGGVLLRLVPPVDPATAPVSRGAALTNTWSNPTHASEGGYYLIGRSLASATTADHQQQGPNLIANGECESDGGVLNWRADGGVLESCAESVPGIEPFFCTQGRTSLRLGGGAAARIETTRPLHLVPGYYVLSGTVVADPAGHDVVRLVGDFDRDGSDDVREELSLRFDDRFLASAGSWPARFELTLPVPVAAGVRVQFDHPAGADGLPLIDDVALRRLLSPVAPLIPDPGAANIVVTGDSWAMPFHRLGEGLSDGLRERLGRSVAGQVISTGRGGCTARQLLENWDEMVGVHEPSVVVISVGINEAVSGRTAPEAYAEHLRAIVRRSAQIGAMPVFLSVPPIGTGDVFQRARALRDVQKRVLLR